MTTGGIILRHKISVKGIEVDPVKIEVIEKLPRFKCKGVRIFLGDVDFYRIFGKDILNISKTSL